MALYCYIKAQPLIAIRPKTALPNQMALKTVHFISPFMVIIGSLLLFVTTYPFLNYRLLVMSKNQKKIVAPIPDRVIAQAKNIISPLSPAETAWAQGEEVIVNENVDYSKINSWFPTAPLPRVKESKITHYSLSVPKLNIKDAIVEIGGTDIKEKLIQYPGTALPGEYGNTVIFGHSVLPIFYNPKNYTTIFSTLPTLEKGDKIHVNFDSIQFVYQVEKYFEVGPEESQVLQQQYDEQIISLITCVPPGTYLRRGVIIARLTAT